MRYSRPIRVGLVAGVAALGYASLVETRWFRLRRYTVPVLRAGRRPIRVLHISDAHLTPSQHRKIAWIRALDLLEPDLVVNTGDSISHPDAVPHFMSAVEALLQRPGVYVFGSNDYYAPRPRNPLRYLWESGDGIRTPPVETLPWDVLGRQLAEAGWLDMTHRKERLRIGECEIGIAGIDDSHVGRDRYDEIAGARERDVDVRIGMMHTPEPRNLDRFVADGYDLLLAGHTHGGQLCVPGYGALVTNCGLDPPRARGLSRHGRAWLHVSGGLGTSPWAPARFACRPEAALLTLVPRG